MSVSEPATGRRRAEGPTPPQSETPYLDALLAYARRHPGRYHVPGHKGGVAIDPGLREAIGDAALELDIPALTPGIDVGPEPTPFQQAQALAAEAWGARRSWFLINGASQGNHVALVTLAHSGREVVVQRNGHSSTIDALVVSGLRPTFVAPELDPELHIAHCITPESLDRALSETPAAVGATVVSPTYFGAVADVAGLAEVAHSHDVPLVVDEDRKSTRLNSSHLGISYAVFCLKKKKIENDWSRPNDYCASVTYVFPHSPYTVTGLRPHRQNRARWCKTNSTREDAERINSRAY